MIAEAAMQNRNFTTEGTESTDKKRGKWRTGKIHRREVACDGAEVAVPRVSCAARVVVFRGVGWCGLRPCVGGEL